MRGSRLAVERGCQVGSAVVDGRKVVDMVDPKLTRRGSRSGLTPQLIEELKRKGWTQSRIAKEFGVSRQAVSDMKRRYPGYSKTPREEVMEHFPWKVPTKLHDSTYNMRMRDHMEFRATSGKGMSDDKLSRLRSFYELLTTEDLVVEFDPDLPPPKGQIHGGFRLVPREESDGKLMIRVNDHTTLTEEGSWLLRIPKEWPEAS